VGGAYLVTPYNELRYFADPVKDKRKHVVVHQYEGALSVLLTRITMHRLRLGFLVVAFLAAGCDTLRHAGQVRVATPDTVVVPFDPNDAVFSSSDGVNLGWDHGVLVTEPTTDDPRHSTVVTVRFAGKSWKRLTSLIISTPDWILDATKYVRNLPSPMPNRIHVGYGRVDSSGKPLNVEVGLPYRQPNGDPELGEWHCMYLNLRIENDRVESGGIEESSDEVCLN